MGQIAQTLIRSALFLFNLTIGLLIILILGLLLGLIAFPDLAYSDVNLRKASYSTHFIDVQTTELEITRRYDSRSLHNGLFGFGWCSNLETTLKKGLAGEWRLVECDQHSSELQPSQAHVQTDGRVIINLKDRTLTFDSDGRLIALQNARGPEVTLSYTPRGLARLAATGRGKDLRLTLDPLAHHVTHLTLPNGTSVTYTYLADDLTQVRNAWSNTYTFHYDSLHNLDDIAYPDHTHETMSYDTDRDLLLAHRDRQGCREAYEYRGTLHLTATARKTCAHTAEIVSTFEFWHSQQSNGKLRLDRSRIQQGRNITEMHFHPLTGAITKLTHHTLDRQPAQNRGRGPAQTETQNGDRI